MLSQINNSVNEFSPLQINDEARASAGPLVEEDFSLEKTKMFCQEWMVKVATQIMKLICKSGLGDVGFHNINVNVDTGKLAFYDTEPLFGSMHLNEELRYKKHQYSSSDDLRESSSNAESSY